eukprot:3537920-Prymnesium_polylepis.1
MVPNLVSTVRPPPQRAQPESFMPSWALLTRSRKDERWLQDRAPRCRLHGRACPLLHTRTRACFNQRSTHRCTWCDSRLIRHWR